MNWDKACQELLSGAAIRLPHWFPGLSIRLDLNRELRYWTRDGYQGHFWVRGEVMEAQDWEVYER